MKLNFPPKSYLRWTTLQRLNELNKSIVRDPTPQRIEERDRLEAYLEEINKTET